MLRTSRPAKVGIYTILILWALITLFPIYWTLITSVKTPDAVYRSTPAFLPFIDYTPSLVPFLSIFFSGYGYETGGLTDVGLLLRNSLIASLGSGVLASIIGCMAAYALSRFRYQRWNNENIMFFIISQRMMPPVALAVPYFVLFNFLGALDSPFTLLIVYTAMNLPIVVWLLRDYFADIPIDIEESALVDGCSRIGAFWRIAMPLVLPGLVVAFLFAFVFAWNEFLFALTLTFNNKTLPVQLAGNVTLRGPRYWDIAAQGAVVMLPPLFVALLAGRYIIRGLTFGAVK